jgi:hypothetical protein
VTGRARGRTRGRAAARRCAIGCALVAAALAPGALRAGGTDPAPGALRARVQHAFDRTLHAPGVRSLELRVHRAGRLVSRRAFDLAYRRTDGRARSLLRFTAPAYLRGHALLVVESEHGGTDAWLYRTETRRSRRVGSAHHADSFYGSDLTFEELEPIHFDAWELRRVPDPGDGEPRCAVFDAVPGGDSQYGRLRIWIEASREAVARIDFFRGGEPAPMKRLRIELAGAEEVAGYLHIRRMRVEQLGRDAWTEIRISRQVIDPSIPEDVFTAAFLERGGEDLYGWVGRHAAAGGTP